MNRKKIIVITSILIVVLVAGTAGVFFALQSNHNPHEPSAKQNNNEIAENGSESAGTIDPSTLYIPHTKGKGRCTLAPLSEADNLDNYESFEYCVALGDGYNLVYSEDDRGSIRNVANEEVFEVPNNYTLNAVIDDYLIFKKRGDSFVITSLVVKRSTGEVVLENLDGEVSRGNYDAAFPMIIELNDAKSVIYNYLKEDGTYLFEEPIKDPQPFSDGIAIAETNKETGFITRQIIDLEGNLVVDEEYFEVEYRDAELIRAKPEGKRQIDQFMTKDGEIIGGVTNGGQVTAVHNGKAMQHPGKTGNQEISIYNPQYEKLGILDFQGGVPYHLGKGLYTISTDITEDLKTERVVTTSGDVIVQFDEAENKDIRAIELIDDVITINYTQDDQKYFQAYTLDGESLLESGSEQGRVTYTEPMPIVYLGDKMLFVVDTFFEQPIYMDTSGTIY